MGKTGTKEVPDSTARDLVTAAIAKKAGITVYLMEELTDARLRCEQLKKFVERGCRLISQSPHRDHFYEVAGDVLYGIPDSLFRLDKALGATALAASRLDYEELKQQLKPEKVEELEDVLRNVRIRQIDRRSPFIQPMPQPMAQPGAPGLNPPLPVQGKTAMFKAASQSHIAGALHRIAGEVEAGTIPPREASLRLRRVLMALSQTAQEAVQAMGDIQGSSREEVMKGFKSANPDLTKEQLEEIADHWEKNKDVVKDKAQQ
jgi:DNA-directed RNA polymerase subunit F